MKRESREQNAERWSRIRAQRKRVVEQQLGELDMRIAGLAAEIQRLEDQNNPWRAAELRRELTAARRAASDLAERERRWTHRREDFAARPLDRKP